MGGTQKACVSAEYWSA